MVFLLTKAWKQACAFSWVRWMGDTVKFTLGVTAEDGLRNKDKSISEIEEGPENGDAPYIIGGIGARESR